MEKGQLKQVMTDLAAGHITQKEADRILGKKSTKKNKKEVK